MRGTSETLQFHPWRNMTYPLFEGAPIDQFIKISGAYRDPFFPDPRSRRKSRLPDFSYFARWPLVIQHIPCLMQITTVYSRDRRWLAINQLRVESPKWHMPHGNKFRLLIPARANIFLFFDRMENTCRHVPIYAMPRDLFYLTIRLECIERYYLRRERHFWVGRNDSKNKSRIFCCSQRAKYIKIINVQILRAQTHTHKYIYITLSFLT